MGRLDSKYMSQQKITKILIVVAIILLISTAGYFAYNYWQDKITLEKQENLLPKLNITVYTEGFIKIEIPLENDLTYRDGLIKTVLAADNIVSTYKIYRSTDTTNFVEIATVTNKTGTKYLVVFDTDYPTTAKTLQYKYKRISNSGSIIESEISEVEILRAVEGGHQPWRAQPLWVAESEGAGYHNFRIPCAGWGESGGQPRDDCDVYNLLSESENKEIIEVEVIHDGQPFIIEVRRPIPDIFWWSISEVRKSEQPVEQSQSQNPEIVFADKLSSCIKYKTSFKHPFTGETLEKEILGIVGGKCDYVEQMPNGGKMECKYSEGERIVVAQYYKDVATAESVGTNANVNLGSEERKITYTINGKVVDNPLQEAMNSGVCVIFGY